MNEALPRKWSRRIRLIYIMVTAFGGIVLIVFLLLMWLLYWMKAPVKLPQAGRLIHPDATAYVVVEVSPGTKVRRLPSGFPGSLVLGTPEQARNLILKGLTDKECQVRVVASVVPSEKTPAAMLAVSLGRYPGLFRVVRKDLRRRCESGSLDASVSHHNEDEIFTGFDGAAGLDALSLIECTMLRGSSKAIVEDSIDRLDSEEDSSPNWPAPFVVIGDEVGDISTVHIGGWLKDWQHMPLSGIMPEHKQTEVEAFATRLAEAVPGMTRASDFHFFGQCFLGTMDLGVDFKPATDDDPEVLGKALQDWLRDNEQALGIHVTGVSVKKGRIEFSLLSGEGIDDGTVQFIHKEIPVGEE